MKALQRAGGKYMKFGKLKFIKKEKTKNPARRAAAFLMALLTAVMALPAVFGVGAYAAGDSSEISLAEVESRIRGAVNSAKAHEGLSESDSLLGSKGFAGGHVGAGESSTEGASSTRTDWMALAMARFGYFDGGAYHYMIDDGDGYAEYLRAMREYVETAYEKRDGVLDNIKATEWHRAIITVLSLGGSPLNFGTYNGAPINLVADGCYDCKVPGGPARQDINAWIWGLISLDAGGYDVPQGAAYPRETFITEILKCQLADGGWALGGYSSSEADITAMALQALAPYYNDETVYNYVSRKSGQTVSKTARRCINEALDRLGELMREDGAFPSAYGDDAASETVSQVITALCSLGIDLTADARFITPDGKTLIDSLMTFWVSDGGGFRHTANGKWSSMANDQATYALVSYWRFKNGMRALYDMRGEMTPEARRAVDEAMRLADSAPTISADPAYKGALASALEAFYGVPESERRYVLNYNTLAEKIEFVGGKAALYDSSIPYAVSISVTKEPDKILYYENEKFDAAGMIVTALYSDGSEAPVSKYTLTPTGLLKKDDTEIQIKYGILKTYFPITVISAPDLQIGTVDELIDFSNQVNSGNSFKGKVVTLTADIDLDGVVWSPIAYKSSNAFEGTFDGGYHVIKNLFSMTKGIFGCAGQNAVICNLGVESGAVMTTNSDIGVIVGECRGASVINCWNGADVTFLKFFSYGGGVVGSVRTSVGGLISGCFNTGRIKAQNGPIGGVVGYLATNADVTVENCYNVGSVTLTDGSSAGGVAGQIQDNNTIVNCYGAGSVTGAGGGAIAGSLSGGVTVENCLYDSDVSPCAVGNGNHTDKTHGIPTREMRGDESVAALGKAYKADEFGFVNGGYPILYWQKTEKADAIKRVTEKIEAIGEVTSDSGEAVREARELYDALDGELREYITDYEETLLRAEAAYAELVSAAKEEAKRELEGYKDFSNYRAEQQKQLLQIIEDGKREIDGADDVNIVRAALEKIKAEMDGVKTANQLSAEEEGKESGGGRFEAESGGSGKGDIQKTEESEDGEEIKNETVSPETGDTGVGAFAAFAALGLGGIIIAAGIFEKGKRGA